MNVFSRKNEYEADAFAAKYFVMLNGIGFGFEKTVGKEPKPPEATSGLCVFSLFASNTVTTITGIKTIM